MFGRLMFPLILGVGGIAVLIGLGTWQLQRLEWKEGVLAAIDARMAADPVSVPASPSEDADQYLRVAAEGILGEAELHVLSGFGRGAGYRIIRALEIADQRTILVDLGKIPEAEKGASRQGGLLAVEGVLLWPDETDSYTPEPNLERNIWFARNVETMADALQAEPVLLVASDISPEFGTALEAVAVNIPNDHLEYAITWFSIAIVWACMTLYLIWRIRRKTV